MLGAGLHEVELALLELEVRAVGVEEIAQDLLALVRLELLTPAGDGVRARLDIRPYGDIWWVASDFGPDLRPGAPGALWFP